MIESKGIITCTDDAQVTCHYCEVCRCDTEHIVVSANNFIGVGDDIGELHTCVICRVGKIHIRRGERARGQVIETIASRSMEPLPTIFELDLDDGGQMLKRLLCIIGWHRWSRWEEEIIAADLFTLSQRRQCERCGIVKRRRI